MLLPKLILINVAVSTELKTYFLTLSPKNNTMLSSMAIKNDINIGLYGFATDRYCLLGAETKERKTLKKVLKVPLINSTALDTELVKIFITGNSFGVIVPKILEEYEMACIKAHFENVFVLDSVYSALGNLILMNDSGIVLSPLLKNHKKDLSSFFQLPCEVSTIARLRTVGTLGIATNKGCAVHPKIYANEKTKIKDVLSIEVAEATVNFGSMHVGAGIIANSHGALVGSATSGHELGVLNEALGFMK
jgi:translation initiation factor 6